MQITIKRIDELIAIEEKACAILSGVAPTNRLYWARERLEVLKLARERLEQRTHLTTQLHYELEEKFCSDCKYYDMWCPVNCPIEKLGKIVSAFGAEETEVK